LKSVSENFPNGKVSPIILKVMIINVKSVILIMYQKFKADIRYTHAHVSKTTANVKPLKYEFHLNNTSKLVTTSKKTKASPLQRSSG
jgi:hypothetical protein